jgi:hypothetical protein
MSNDLVPTILVDQEIAAIESEMGNRGSDYWRSPAKQARVLSLYAQRNAATPSGYSDPTVLLPIASEAEFHAEAGPDASYSFYLDMMRYAADVVLKIPDGEQASFVASFEALPDDVAAVALDELMASKPPVDWVSEQAVHAFSQLPEGASLVHLWGHDARKNMAVVRERIWRVYENVPTDSDATRFLDWHERLSTGAKIALYRKLAA